MSLIKITNHDYTSFFLIFSCDYLECKFCILFPTSKSAFFCYKLICLIINMWWRFRINKKTTIFLDFYLLTFYIKKKLKKIYIFLNLRARSRFWISSSFVYTTKYLKLVTLALFLRSYTCSSELIGVQKCTFLNVQNTFQYSFLFGIGFLFESKHIHFLEVNNYSTSLLGIFIYIHFWSLFLESFLG